MADYLLLIVALAVLAVAAVTGLVVGKLRRSRRTSEASAHTAPGTRAGAGADPAAGSTAVAVDQASPDVEAPVERPVEIERPEPPQGRMVRLRSRLAGSESTLGRGLLTLLARDQVDEEIWEQIEDTLLTSDLGVDPTNELVARLRTRVRAEGAQSAGEARAILRDELVALLDPALDRDLHVSRRGGQPGVALVVGVNGSGKTTTVGKIARVLVAQDEDVVLAAADTFRAAAADQLQTWGERVGVHTVRGPEGGDPASVGYEAVMVGIEREADAVLVDTAGRLHTKAGLMDELGKVKRVVEKLAPVTEVLLVLDATTGQNGMRQARVFSEVVDVSGIVLTKLDGTAKGGIVVAVQRELGVPVKLVGLGEGADDLAPFEPEAFVDALLGESSPA
ncbi:MAG: signal recognition particle-docking protein FtsY [Nocardioidaceae bacterium]